VRAGISANNIDALFDFSAVAIAAWNAADKSGEALAQDIALLKKRMKRDVIANGEESHPVDDLFENGNVLLPERNKPVTCRAQVAFG
jgi:hypothetical protein